MGKMVFILKQGPGHKPLPSHLFFYASQNTYRDLNIGAKQAITWTNDDLQGQTT